MADITISYKDNIIAEINESGSKKLLTKGKYCEDDISIDYVKSGGGGGDIDALIDRSITEITSNAESIGTFAFYGCKALETADFSLATNIGSGGFQSCSTLSSLIIRSETICKLSHTNAFNNSSITSGTGYIYVPSALVEDYKVATNWSTYASQFRALEDYTVDGTVTGELDESKI